ncbi:hypothetical protein [Falsirhodobacter xinxiangensis]|uniref:hypothetical protein n=1 Tax=Falsirhodobacter xinxiangensis TaxID=2530049 RepID=UPI0010AA019B|nr:hypothetical protein [Rhodobacter xinxiangensis]
MQIVYHLGAHCTDEERLLRCLLKNREALGDAGVMVPGPARYRNLIRDTATALRRMPATDATQEEVLDQIMDAGTAERLILSWENFLSFPQWVVRGRLYPAAGERVRSFTNIFPSFGAELHIAIRNPATFLPALFQRQRGKSAEDFLGGIDPMGLRWSEVIADLLAQDMPVTVWCDEDTPLIWPEVLRAVAGVDIPLEGEDELLATIMDEKGIGRLRAHMVQPLPVEERRNVTAALLEEHAKPEMVDMQIEMPGWTPELVDAMTDAYEEDILRIMAMPGVRFLSA